MGENNINQYLIGDQSLEYLKNYSSTIKTKEFNLKKDKGFEQAFLKENIHIVNKHLKRYSISLLIRESKPKPQ